MKNIEVEKSKAFFIAEIIDYIPNAVVAKTIIKKTTGSVTAISVDAGEILSNLISPFDTFIQIIEEQADIMIDDHPYMVKSGQSIIIPAHSKKFY
ncbi:cupin [Kaistella jeonii]|uniref:cupin n=1 Tax=Kaistella jeonii TaxID=266749 RepID=UPI0008EADC04|nr:cupin [Kaistella jeonii]SFB98382.1 hypothetical protein SAMN05421876_104244 [Kaistella jeonii]VEI97265.1 Uncharacterised protein [Kaistella jeonii]